MGSLRCIYTGRIKKVDAIKVFNEFRDVAHPRPERCAWSVKFLNVHLTSLVHCCHSSRLKASWLPLVEWRVVEIVQWLWWRSAITRHRNRMDVLRLERRIKYKLTRRFPLFEVRVHFLAGALIKRRPLPERRHEYCITRRGDGDALPFSDGVHQTKVHFVLACNRCRDFVRVQTVARPFVIRAASYKFLFKIKILIFFKGREIACSIDQKCKSKLFFLF